MTVSPITQGHGGGDLRASPPSLPGRAQPRLPRAGPGLLLVCVVEPVFLVADGPPAPVVLTAPALGPPESPCELHCRPSDEPFAEKLRDAVVDGTPCYQASRDLCINGICKVRWRGRVSDRACPYALAGLQWVPPGCALRLPSSASKALWWCPTTSQQSASAGARARTGRRTPPALPGASHLLPRACRHCPVRPGPSGLTCWVDAPRQWFPPVPYRVQCG